MYMFTFIFNPHPRTLFFFYCFYGEKKGDKKEEGSIDWLRPVYAKTRDQTCNLGMCSDQELNLQPFGYGMMLQPTEPHRPGQFIY